MNITRTMSFEQRLGYIGERWAMAELQRRGYTVRMVSDFFADVDLIIEADCNLPVEVKTATAKWQSNGQGSYRQRWQFDCARVPEGIDSVVILIAIADRQYHPFVIPSWALKARGTRQPVITSHPSRYTGWIARYRDDWPQIEKVLGVKDARTVKRYLLGAENGNGVAQ